MSSTTTSAGQRRCWSRSIRSGPIERSRRLVYPTPPTRIRPTPTGARDTSAGPSVECGQASSPATGAVVEMVNSRLVGTDRFLVLKDAGTGVDLSDDRLLAGVDVGRAGHARVEAADRPQDVDPLVLVRRAELLQDRRVHDRLLVRTGLAPGVSRRGVLRGGRADLVVRDDALVERQMVRQVAAPGPPEPDADPLVPRHRVRRADAGLAALEQLERRVQVRQRDQG